VLANSSVVLANSSVVLANSSVVLANSSTDVLNYPCYVVLNVMLVWSVGALFTGITHNSTY
jgi:hypothetical protein